MSLILQYLDMCNAFLVSIPLDIQGTLFQALQILEVHTYQQAHMIGMKQELF